MISAKLLRDVLTEVRPIIERQLDDAELIAGFREVIASNGGDWGSLKALIKAQIQDERDEAGDGKRVRKILDKADYSAAYADMLGLGNITDLNFSAETAHDPETGEILEDSIPKSATEAAAAASEGSSIGKRSGGEASLTGGAVRGDGMASASMHANVSEGVTSGERPAHSSELEIPGFLLRTAPQQAGA